MENLQEVKKRLATIERITNFRPIEGADRICQATCLAYNIVIKKSEFQEGDLVIFILSDTICPELPQFQFLEKQNWRIKICKLKGARSQGLAVPLKEFNLINAKEGDDVTDIIGVLKYEKDLPQSRDAVGRLPSFIRRTDEDNLLSHSKCTNEFNSCNYYATVKMDGSSSSFYVKDKQFGVCSRGFELKEDEGNYWWQAVYKYNLREKMLLLEEDVCIQCELVGEKMNGNKTKIKGRELFMFDVWNIKEQKYMGLECLTDYSNNLEIPYPKIIECGFFNHTIESLQNLADSVKYENGDAAEGIVVRPTEPKYSEILGKRLSVKVINTNYKE